MRFFSLATLAVLATAGCTQTPTVSTVQRAPAFDGLGLGSGHVVMPPDNTTTTVAASGATATTTDSTSSGRGGLGLGSGH